MPYTNVCIRQTQKQKQILHRFGGLYVDVDMECLLPHDALHSREHFYAGFSHTGTVELNNGVIG